MSEEQTPQPGADPSKEAMLCLQELHDKYQELHDKYQVSYLCTDYDAARVVDSHFPGLAALRTERDRLQEQTRYDNKQAQSLGVDLELMRQRATAAEAERDNLKSDFDKVSHKLHCYMLNEIDCRKRAEAAEAVVAKLRPASSSVVKWLVDTADHFEQYSKSPEFSLVMKNALMGAVANFRNVAFQLAAALAAEEKENNEG